MASEAIVNETLIPYYYISQTIGFLLTLCLLIFHVYRIKQNEKRGRKKNRTQSVKLLRILDLRIISYCCLTVILLAYFIFLTALIINLYSPYLNHSLCELISYIQTTLLLLSRFFFHLFVAVRSRFSSHRRKFSIYGKIGMGLITMDIALIFGYWIAPNQQIVELSENNVCIPVSYGTLYVIWVLCNDAIITPYCLLAFVLPLRGIIKLEKKQMEMHRVNSNNSIIIDTTSTKDELSISNLVRKIIICNTIAMAQILVQCGLASNAWTGNISGIIMPQCDVIGCYVVIMQFADVDINNIQSKFWRIYVSIFQWNEWKCIENDRCIGCKKRMIDTMEDENRTISGEDATSITVSM